MINKFKRNRKLIVITLIVILFLAFVLGNHPIITYAAY